MKCIKDEKGSKTRLTTIHTYFSRTKLGGEPDSQLELRFGNEWLCWRQMLRRAAAAVELMATLRLTFRDTMFLQIK
jgi:hypothetical protein